MQTASHLLITAAIRKWLGHVRIVPSALLLGAVSPDLPRYFLSLGGILYYRVLLGWSSTATLRYMFDYLYFHQPFWLAAHNVLHSPTLLVLVLAGLWRVRQHPHP